MYIKVPNTNNDHSNKSGNIYAMFFGMWNERWAIVKVGKSVDTAQRAVQHYSTGNKHIQGRIPQVLMNITVCKQSQTICENANREIWDSSKGFYRAKGCQDTFFLDTYQTREIPLVDRHGARYTFTIPQAWEEMKTNLEIPPIMKLHYGEKFFLEAYAILEEDTRKGHTKR